MNYQLRAQIANEIFGPIDSDGYGQCPGHARHTTGNERRDFLVKLDGVATGYCVHSSCETEVADFNRKLRKAIHVAESGGMSRPFSAAMGEGVAPKPVAPRPPRYPKYQPEALAELASRCRRPITLDWMAERSPLPLPPASMQGPETAKLFLTSLYKPGEKVLVFSRNCSQGDFMIDVASGESMRLGDTRDVAAVPSALPAAGAEGIWFLTNPVSGEWKIQPAVTAGGGARWGRRHGGCITSWRYLLLESDQAPEDLWLRALIQLPLPLAGIFTSGGRSIHSLVRVDADSKSELDSVRNVLREKLGPLGCDSAALTAVRLARLPGCLRLGRRDPAGKYQRHDSPPLQKLIWLNPTADKTPIMDFCK